MRAAPFPRCCCPDTITRAFLATYIGLFAVLLCLFETRVKVRGVRTQGESGRADTPPLLFAFRQWTEPYIRRLFGFMFTFTGRAVFLIFLGAIAFGERKERGRGECAIAFGAGTVCCCTRCRLQRHSCGVFTPLPRARTRVRVVCARVLWATTPHPYLSLTHTSVVVRHA